MYCPGLLSARPALMPPAGPALACFAPLAAELSGGAAQPAAASASAAAAGVTHHQSPRNSLWARARRLLTLDALFDSLDELFELGDNLDLAVGAALWVPGWVAGLWFLGCGWLAGAGCPLVAGLVYDA